VTAMEFWTWAGGRRFALTVCAGIVHTGLLIFGILSEANYVALTMSTVAVYISANTAQKWKEATSAR